MAALDVSRCFSSALLSPTLSGRLDAYYMDSEGSLVHL